MTLTVDITAPGGVFTPAAKGDAQQITATFSITSGTASLQCTSATPFVSGDTGKSFVLPGAGAAGAALTGTLTFVNSSTVTLSLNASTTLTNSSRQFTWGTDDAPAFRAFNTYAVANQASQQVILNIPANTYLSGSGDTNTNTWFKGIKNLVVNGNNAVFYANGTGYFRLGGGGQYHDSAHDCRLATVNAGVSTVQLIDSTIGTAASRISLFSVNDFVLVSGLDLQSTTNPNGYPANSHFFEFKQIQSVDSTNKTVTFTSPLANSYKSIWPNFNTGTPTSGEVDPGGQASIYALDTWDCDHTYNDLKMNQVGLQMTMSGRNLVMNRGKIYDPSGMIPSQNSLWQLNGTDLSGCSLEIDKLIATAEFNNIVGTFTIDVQSSSVDTLNVNNCTVHELDGSPKVLNVSGTTITDALTLGAHSYGRSDRATISNSSFLRLLRGGSRFSIPTSTFPSVAMSAGVISSPKGDGALPFPPGTNIFWDAGSNGDSYASAKVVDQFDDASNVYLQTNLAGGFPTNLGATVNGVRAHDCPQLTMTSCTGCNDATSMSKAPPGAPAFSYSFRTYTEATNYTFADEFTGGANHIIVGKIKQITVNVISAYASGPLSLVFTADVLKMSSSTLAIWNSINIDLTATGSRIITPSGATGTKPGDSGLSFPDVSTWIGALATVNLSGSPVSAFTATIEVLTDQGLIPLAVTPLRMRLFAA